MPPVHGFAALLFLVATQPTHVDRYGDPLPPGAVARLGTVTQRQAEVWVIHFAHDGRTFHGLAGDTWTRWDAATGRRLQSVRLPGGRAWLSEDGSTAMCVDASGVHRVIDCATRRVRLVLPDWADFTQVTHPLSPDGRYVAGFDRKHGGVKPQNVRVWDTATGAVRNLGPQGDVMCQVRFSPDGTRLVAHSGLMATCWDRATGKRLWQTKPVPLDWHPVLFSPDGRLIAATKRSGPGRVEVWDADTGRAPAGLKRPPDTYHQPLGFTADHEALVLADLNEAVAWNLRTGKYQHRAPVHRAAGLSPDGRYVIATPDRVLERWDLTTGKQLYPDTSERGHTGALLAATFDPTGRRVITASWDNTIRVWDARSGRLLTTHAVPPDGDAYKLDVMFARDGRRALVATPQRKRAAPRVALVVDLETGKADKSCNWVPLRNVPNVIAGPDHRPSDWVRWNFQAGHSYPRTGVVIPLPHFTGRRRQGIAADFRQAAPVLVPPRDRSAKELRDLPGVTLSVPDGVACGDVEFTADERFVAVRVCRRTPNADHPIQTGDQLGVQIWDTLTGGRLVRLPAHGTGPVRLACGGRFLVGLEPDGLAVWRVATGRRVAFDSAVGCDTALALSPDGRTALTTHRDGTSLVWDIASARRVPGKVPPTPADLLADWEALGDPNPARRLAALWHLVDHPAQSVPFLRAKAVPENRVPAEAVRKLIAELDHDDFRTRDAAEKQLRRLGAPVYPLLSEAAAGRISPEQADRLGRLLARLDSRHRRPLAAADLPRAWAVAALERIGTPAARAVLRELTGAGDRRLTHEAKAALARLAGGK
jgi:WD40 repeat protein